LNDETQLEAWVQSKLTKAADYIKTVKHYVEYGMEEGAYDQVQPEMGTEMPQMGGVMPNPDEEAMGFEYDSEEFGEFYEYEDEYDEEY